MLSSAALDAVVAMVRDAGRPVLVAVDGRSGSGKSTFAEAVVARLRATTGADVTLLRTDAVYPGWDGLGAAVRVLREEVLPRLAAGEEATYRSWLWTRSRPGPVRAVRPAHVVVVEGVGSGAAADLVDCLVWVEAPEQVRHRRAMARDGDGYAPHWDTWAAQEVVHFAAHPTRPRAHVVVDTDGGEDTDDEDEGPPPDADISGS